jgi:hypothetical protein
LKRALGLFAAAAAGAGAAALLALGAAGAAQGVTAAPTTVAFGDTGAEQMFTVPSGVTSLHVVAVGARGGMGSADGLVNVGGTGGFGARLDGDLAVTPGEVLFVEVGGMGAAGGGAAGGGGGGFNGGGSSDDGVFHTPGGGGGGATDIRTCSRLAPSCAVASDTLSSRILVAAGGGGGGTDGQEQSGTGGGGGAAGAPGQDGQSLNCSTGSTPGNGGPPAGNAGVLGQGGAAGSGGSNSEPGGGGGGGRYGGGAGGSGNGCSAAGGGGGSNLVPPSTSIGTDTAGTPSVTLSYTPPSTTTTTTTTTSTPPPTAAIISNATQSHKSWRESKNPKLAQVSRKRAPVGTAFRFSLDKAAAIRFKFMRAVPGRKADGRCVAPTARNRHKPRCSRTEARGTLSSAGHAGRNTVNFYGWLSRSKKLKPGKYTVVITATTPGVGSTSQKLTFTLLA